MAGEDPSPTSAFCLQEPGQRVDHHYSVVPGTAEEIDAVPVRVVFLLPAVAISNQGAGERRETAAAGEQLAENNHADAHSGAERLRLAAIAEILVAEPMRQHPPQLRLAALP